MEKNILDDSLYDIDKDYQQVEYAGFINRAFAAIVDAFVFIPFALINTYLIVSTGDLAASILTTLASLIYKPMMEGYYGATLGKMALNIKIINEQHQTINMEESIIRNSPWILSNIAALLLVISPFGSLSSMLISIQGLAGLFLFVSAIFVIFDERKQALHDKFGNTFCVFK